MKFQEVLEGMILTGQPVWILSGISSCPHSCLATILKMDETTIVTSGLPDKTFTMPTLFVLIGSTLFVLTDCVVKKSIITYTSSTLVFPTRSPHTVATEEVSRRVIDAIRPGPLQFSKAREQQQNMDDERFFIDSQAREDIERLEAAEEELAETR
jgi:hypothetical protein